MTRIRNISEGWKSEETQREGLWKYRDLSGDHLGVRIEEIEPGATTSVHHYHTTEEEHVLLMEGELTLVLGDEDSKLKQGDHVWFPAGEQEAHHFRNDADQSAKVLVFGERRQDDVVVYPEKQVMLVKALGRKFVTYRGI